MFTPWKESYDQPRQYIQSRDISLPTKIHLVKAMVFPVVMHRCESDYKESWAPKNWCFWTVVLEEALERLFSSSLLSAIMVVSSVYLKLLIFLPAIFIPACALFSPAFHVMYSAYTLYLTYIARWQYTALMSSVPNLEPVHCSMSSSNFCFLTWCRFLRRQVRWSDIPISFRIFHSLLWSTESKPLALLMNQK